MSNRELKFRIWDKSIRKFGRMGEYGFIYQYGLIHGNVKHPVLDCYYNPDVVIQQYTGLKDKNDVEIYEGDIVTFKERPRISERGEFEDREGYERKNVLIFWDNKECGFRFKLNNYRQSEKILYESIEVIGNIFETPELLLK